MFVIPAADLGANISTDAISLFRRTNMGADGKKIM